MIMSAMPIRSIFTKAAKKWCVPPRNDPTRHLLSTPALVNRRGQSDGLPIVEALNALREKK